MGFVGQAHELQPVPGDGFGLVVRRGGRTSKGRCHDHITQGREIQKRADHLKGTGNTAFADGVTGQPMNRFALQEDTPLVGGKFSGNEVEQGGFPRSIRTDEPGNLALLDAAVHLMQRQQPAEAFRHVTDLKQLHRLPRRHHRWLANLNITAVPPPAAAPHTNGQSRRERHRECRVLSGQNLRRAFGEGVLKAFFFCL